MVLTALSKCKVHQENTKSHQTVHLHVLVMTLMSHFKPKSQVSLVNSKKNSNTLQKLLPFQVISDVERPPRDTRMS